MKILICCLTMLFLVGCGFEIVDTGYRGVQTTFGKVSSDSMPEGLYFYNPFSSDITEMDVRVKTLTDKIQCYTKDIQKADITIVLMANLMRDSAHLMLKEYGRDWENAVVPNILQGTVKTVIGKWIAVDLIANREAARKEVEDLLASAFKDKYVSVVKFELTNIDYDDAFEKAVEEKVVATQSAITAQNKTKQIEEEAKQQIISAKAEAESMRIRANALTQNKSLVEWEAVKTWNGVLPTMMMGNTVPFINIGK